MKPVVVTHRIHPDAVELLSSICEVVPFISRRDSTRAPLLTAPSRAHVLLLPTNERIDEALVDAARELGIVARASHIPEHIDISAGTRHGVWLTTLAAHDASSDAELIAACNTLDALGGDTPRDANSALLEIISVAGRRDGRRVAAIT